MKVDQIRDMKSDEIQTQIVDMQKEVMHLRMSNAIGTSESPVEIRHKKRAIARMKTVLRERQAAKR